MPRDVADLTATSDVAFVTLDHHDGRFVRRRGVFAFCRRDPDGGHTVLHLESAVDISRAAISDHPRWDWAVTQGMNALLVSVETPAPAQVIALSSLRFAPSVA